MKTIRSLILDMGGVLTEPQRPDKARELHSLIGADCSFEAFTEAYFGKRAEYDRGAADRLAYWRAVASELGASDPEPRVDELTRVDLESWFNMRGAMLAFLREASGSVRSLVLLSNIHDDGARYLRAGPGRAWASTFDALVLSCDHLLVKPDPAIYGIAVGAAGVPAGECLFVDDSQANVEAALRSGLESFRFVDEDDFIERMGRDYALSR
jgi:putative hydrolase of the HAD superfamily